MDIKRKLELVEQSIKSISTHSDEDAAVRLAAFDAIGEMLVAQRDAVNAEVATRIEQAVG